MVTSVVVNIIIPYGKDFVFVAFLQLLIGCCVGVVHKGNTCTIIYISCTRIIVKLSFINGRTQFKFIFVHLIVFWHLGGSVIIIGFWRVNNSVALCLCHVMFGAGAVAATFIAQPFLKSRIRSF